MKNVKLCHSPLSGIFLKVCKNVSLLLLGLSSLILSVSVQPAMSETDLCSDYVTKKEYDMAIEECTKLIQSGKMDDATYFINRGRAYFNKNQYDLAIADFSKAIELNPGLDDAFLKRGITYYYKGQYDLAIADFNKVIELNPKSDGAYFNRGLAYYYGKRQYDSAIADFSTSIELNPKFAVSENAEKYSARGKAAFDMAKSDEDYYAAIDEFKKAIDSAPWRAQGYYNLGLAQEKAGQIDDAMKNFKLYLLAAPTAKDVQAVKNRIYGLEYKVEQREKSIDMNVKCHELNQAGRKEEAIAACKEAVRLNSKNDSAHYNLGVVLRDRLGIARRQETCPEAIPEFEEAIRLNGYHFNAYINLGNCYNNLKDYRKAISIIEEGIRKCTIDVFTNYNRSTAFAYGQLGGSYDMLDEYEKALNYYEKAKNLGADDPVIDKNMNNIRRKLGR